MSPRKKKSRKKKAVKKKVVKKTFRGSREVKLQRKILPFTAGKLPFVSKTMPHAASAIPLVSKEIPLISKTIPQFSAISNVTIPKKWGKMPSKKWGASKIRPTRRREPKRPKDIGLFDFLGKIITAPYQPVEMVKALTAAIHSQAGEDKDPKAVLRLKLLELKMLREMNKISEDDYKIEETKLKRRIKTLVEKEEAKKKTKEVKVKPKRKKRPKQKKDTRRGGREAKPKVKKKRR